MLRLMVMRFIVRRQKPRSTNGTTLNALAKQSLLRLNIGNEHMELIWTGSCCYNYGYMLLAPRQPVGANARDEAGPCVLPRWPALCLQKTPATHPQDTDLFPKDFQKLFWIQALTPSSAIPKPLEDFIRFLRVCQWVRPCFQLHAESVEAEPG